MSPAELPSGKLPAAQMPGCYYITEKDIHSLHHGAVVPNSDQLLLVLVNKFLTSLILPEDLTLNQKVHIFVLPI